MEISKQELWESRLSDWENSGMDIRSWCRQKNLDEKQFHYWKRQIRMNTAVQETVFAEYTGGTNIQGTGKIRNQPFRGGGKGTAEGFPWVPCHGCVCRI